MKNIKKYFLIASWIIYFGTGRGIVGSIFLMLAGLFLLSDFIPEKGEDNE